MAAVATRPQFFSETSKGFGAGQIKSKITNLRFNKLGALAFDGKFSGINAADEFLVYPLRASTRAERVTIQSVARIGWIVKMVMCI